MSRNSRRSKSEEIDKALKTNTRFSLHLRGWDAAIGCRKQFARRPKMEDRGIKDFRYIKLGSGSSGIDKICIKDREKEAYIGYSTDDPLLYDLAVSEKWSEFRAEYYSRDKSVSERSRKQRSTAATNQVKAFFEADETTLWITFYGGLLYYGTFESRESPRIEPKLGGCLRSLSRGWKCTDDKGKILKVENLSGELTKIRGFQATICMLNEKQSSYLTTRLAGEVPEYIRQIDEARDLMVDAVKQAIRSLQPKDFELLVEIIFSRTWRRIGRAGGSEKFIDIVFEDTLNPDQRYAVQVKSELKLKDLDEYCQDEQINLYKKLFFVFHSPDLADIIDKVETPDGVELIDLQSLANLVVDSGLVHWLKVKTS